MGGSESSHAETKSVEATGQVNNNVVVEFGALRDTVGDYGIGILILLSLLCVLKALEFASYVYMNHIKKMKKKYGTNDVRMV